MTKNLYVAKLKNLSDQINIMLMEAEGLTEASEAMVKNTKLAIEKLFKTSFFIKPGKLSELLKLAEENPVKAWQEATAYMKVAPAESKALITKGTAWQKLFKGMKSFAGSTGGKATIGTIAVALLAAVTAPLLGSLREKLSMNEVKELTGKAMDAKSFQDTTKYINALKKVATNDSLWSKITTAQSARDLAASNVEAFKKSYVTVGAAMCIASVILCVIFAGTVDTFGPLIEAVKKMDIKGIMVGLGKLAIFGLLAVPAMIGACLIYVGLKGFPEEGIAAQVLEALAPVVQLANQAVKSILELAQEAAAQGEQAQPARITRTTKKVK